MSLLEKNKICFNENFDRLEDFNIIMLFMVMRSDDGQVFSFHYNLVDAIEMVKSIDDNSSIGYFKCWCINRGEVEPEFPCDIRHHELVRMIEKV